MDTLGIWVGAKPRCHSLAFSLRRTPSTGWRTPVRRACRRSGTVMGWLNVKNMAITPLTKEGRFVVIIPAGAGDPSLFEVPAVAS